MPRSWRSPGDDSARRSPSVRSYGCRSAWPAKDFLSFQWDLLLVEAEFLAVFAGRSRVRAWLFRWLLFRLTFSSGVVKLLSGDPAWRDLMAMSCHYETQPLPTPLAWYLHQLPLGAQKALTALTLVVELIVPALYFGTRPAPRSGSRY